MFLIFLCLGLTDRYFCYFFCFFLGEASSGSGESQLEEENDLMKSHHAAKNTELPSTFKKNTTAVPVAESKDKATENE